jgi:hypothetical protein
MKNLFKVTMVLALIAFIPSFQPTANANNLLPVLEDQPEVITFFNAGQTNPGEVTMAWQSNCEDYKVTIYNITTGVPLLILFPVMTNTFTQGNLVVGHTYRFIITDCDSTFGQTLTITF